MGGMCKVCRDRDGGSCQKSNTTRRSKCRMAVYEEADSYKFNCCFFSHSHLSSVNPRQTRHIRIPPHKFSYRFIHLLCIAQVQPMSSSLNKFQLLCLASREHLNLLRRIALNASSSNCGRNCSGVVVKEWINIKVGLVLSNRRGW